MSKFIRASAVMGLTMAVVLAVAGAQEPPAKEEMKAKPGMDKMMKGGTGKELPKLDAGPAAQDAIFFSSDGPVRVRYTATIEGKPASTVWNDALAKLFAFCDRNSDGVLDTRERAAFNRPRMAYSFVDVEGNLHTTGGRQVTFTETSGKVDKGAFLAGFVASGMSAVTLTTKPSNKQTDRMTNTLFKLLDTNTDGKLSADELKAAPERLRTLDVNDDELVTTQELLGRGYGNDGGNYFVAQSFSDGTTRQPVAAPGDFLFPSADPGTAAKEVMTARDKNKDGTLTKDELGYAKGAGPCLADKDGDGKVTLSELIAWLRTPPDLEFALDFGDAEKTKTIVGKALQGLSELVGRSTDMPNGLTLLQPRGEKSPFADRTGRDGNDVKLKLTDSRVRFTANRDLLASLKANWQGSVQNVKSQYDQLAGDKKVVERKQFNENPQLAEATNLFDLGDRNADGKLTAKEVETAIEALRPMTGCRVEIAVSEQGRGLFELIDTDSDNRLSPRELAAASAIIKALDRNRDGLLDKLEIPRNFVVEAVPSSANAISFNQFYFDAVVFGGGQTVVVTKAGSAPDWFTKMDRNDDGDLSRREFLGPIELFKKLDTNGDGLVSADEAWAAK